ncbi:MAG: mRNA interferase [Desulfotomaculum sp. 46_296]|nr:MAG: mRNA interferase [Desulfotomaculum sp. 46_296]HAU32012.1 PemK family transcriptional regulator [Desulfotomaculum sp.]
MREVRRGDIFLVDFNPARGSEQAGYRPAVIIQNNVGNKYGSTVIIAVVTTAAIKIYPFLVRLEAGEGGLERESAVNAAQIITVDKSRLVKKIGALSPEKMDEVNRVLKISLDLH